MVRNIINKIRVVGLVIPLFSLSVNLFASEKEKTTGIKDTLKAVNLNSVVISANKTKVNRNNVPLTISVLEKEDIETGGNSALLPILSQHVPGLFVTQRGVIGFGVSSGSAGEINIRGVGQGNKVLMLFDGQPQWAGLFGHSLPDLYVSSDVERVEVIRGPGSLLYGSNAMGGVVNIITRKFKGDGRESRARVSYGSYNTQKYMVNNGYNKGRFSSFVSVNHDRSDGHRSNSEFKITNGFAKAGYKIGEHFNLSGNVSVAKIYSENPGRKDDPITQNEMDIMRASASISLENTHKYGSGALQVFVNAGDHEINDGYKVGELPRSYLFNSNDHNYGVMLYESLRVFKGNSFTLGFDYKNWGGKAWNSSIASGTNTTLSDRNVHETAGYFIVQQEFFDILTINGGLRFEYSSSFLSEWVPQIGLTIKAFPNNVIKGSISKGYRSPNIREMYMFPPQNPNLMPESMVNFELSVGQTMLNSNLIAELSLFYIDGWNMIETLRINGIPKNLNTGFFDNRGFEMMASYRVKPNLRADFNYSYLKTSKPLLAAPTHKLYLSMGYSPGPFILNLNSQYIGGLYLNTATKLQENYLLFNVRASYKRLIGTLDTRFFINGDNITGVSYSVNEGFPMPGVIISAGIDLNF
ncbi:MAG: TonB-dependent receptor [Bacteroidales bacterium]|nr:TonB-dependent receptor [Bacteroidales bacterium]